MPIYRIRRCSGHKGGSNFYHHADVIASRPQVALNAAKQGRVNNWRYIDRFDVASETYENFEFLYLVSVERAENPQNLKPKIKKGRGNVWKSGHPTKPGIYWFDSGINLLDPPQPKPLVLQVTQHISQIYGDGGSMPLNMVYSPKLCKNSKYKEVARPRAWYKFKDALKLEPRRCWVKDKNGNLGLALFRVTDFFIGDIVWLNHPNTTAIHGTWIRKNDGFLFSPVKEPNVECTFIKKQRRVKTK